MEIKRSAFALLAMSARLSNGTNMSDLRVYMTFTSGQFCSTSWPNFLATDKLMFFSLEKRPMAPGSFPPWPASMTKTNLLLFSTSWNNCNKGSRQKRLLGNKRVIWKRSII